MERCAGWLAWAMGLLLFPPHPNPRWCAFPRRTGAWKGRLPAVAGSDLTGYFILAGIYNADDFLTLQPGN